MCSSATNNTLMPGVHSHLWQREKIRQQSWPWTRTDGQKSTRRFWEGLVGCALCHRQPIASLEGIPHSPSHLQANEESVTPVPIQVHVFLFGSVTQAPWVLCMSMLPCQVDLHFPRHGLFIWVINSLPTLPAPHPGHTMLQGCSSR